MQMWRHKPRNCRNSWWAVVSAITVGFFAVIQFATMLQLRASDKIRTKLFEIITAPSI